MYCKNCGKEIEESAKYCYACGKGQTIEDKIDNNQEQATHKTSLAFPIFFIIIAIVGMLFIGLRDEFGEKMWEGKSYEYTGATVYGNYTGHFIVNTGITTLESEDECCDFIRNLGIVLLITGVSCAGISYTIERSKNNN